MKCPFVVAVYFVCFLVLLPPSKLPAASDDFLQRILLEQLEHYPASLLTIEEHGVGLITIGVTIDDVYRENGFQPLWVSGKGPGKQATVLLAVLKTADTEGFNPEDYLLSPIEQYWTANDAVSLARLDILLTLALGGYVADAQEGRINPCEIDPKLFACARDANIDLVQLVEQALASPDLRRFLELQVPANERYQGLRKALAHYRAVAARGGWEPIPEGKTLRPAMHDERVPAIRKRLTITEDLKSDELSSEIYDEKLREAVAHFQTRHGLDVDGVLGKATRKAMNIPVEALIRRTVINMERWRWLSHDLGETRVEVNIAGFVLGVFKRDSPELAMPVIVGKLHHETPVFSDMITYLEFNPYWNIPPSIAENEMLPELEKDPHYLAERTIRVFSSWEADAAELDSTSIDWHELGDDIVRYKLRQDPGPSNALGTVKFVFPNKYNVYLHDTPSHNLFGRSQRAFSHGCIRVSRPIELASYLLGGEEKGWGIDRIKEIIASRERTVVRLEEPVPVHIAYRTVWLDADGSVHFREDVYGRDKLLEEALF